MYLLWEKEQMLSFCNWLDRPVQILGKAGAWLIIPLIVVIMFDVITRRIDTVRIWMANAELAWFNPIIFQDAEWHLHGVLLLLAIGFGYLRNAHVRVDVFRERMPVRRQLKVELIGLLTLGIPFMIVISYFGFQFVALSYSQGEGSESLTGIPARYIVKSFMLLGFALLLMSFISTALRITAALWGGEGVRAQALASLSIINNEGFDADQSSSVTTNGGA